MEGELREIPYSNQNMSTESHSLGQPSGHIYKNNECQVKTAEFAMKQGVSRVQ